MIKNVHRKLTLLCAGITIFVLLFTSLLYLYVTEKNLRETGFSSFQSDMNTLLSNLETQTVFTHEWLSKMEGDGKYILSIRDNGVDFLWDSLAGDPAKKAAVQAGWDYFVSHIEKKMSPDPLSTAHTEFFLPSSGETAEDYYGCVALSERQTGTLSVLILKSLSPLYAQIRTQRLTFLILVTASSLILFFFSYYFTGRLLKPIEENRKKQVQFTAAASHELRTPLSVILSAASACKKASPQEQEGFFDIIRREGEDMSRLISDLLTLSAADTKDLTVTPRLCQPDTLLLNLYESFEPLAREKKRHLKVLLPEEKTAPLWCDEGRVRQVLLILLHNAFSYTREGSAVTLSLSQDGGHVFFSVADNGPGIPDGEKAQIFERFYRGDASRPGTGHFGLGLTIAKEIMTALNGQISVSDAPGGGAVFTLALPRREK